MVYTDAFIQVASDCPVTSGVVPSTTGDRKTIAAIEYELLTAKPYAYTQQDLIFEVHVRHKSIPVEELQARGPEIRAELFRKPHPCMRASALPKRYGWGVHYDRDGRIALFAVGSDEYRRQVEEKRASPRLVNAMRSKRS